MYDESLGRASGSHMGMIVPSGEWFILGMIVPYDFVVASRVLEAIPCVLQNNGQLSDMLKLNYPP